MTKEQLKRVFKFGAIELEDPDPTLPTHEAIKLYAETYAELANAEISEGEFENGKMVYKVLQQKAGTKG